VGVLATPTKLPKVPEIVDPSAFRVAGNVAEVLKEATSRIPVLLPVVAGNWVRIEAGTVNVPAPAVVTQRNSVVVVTSLLPVPVEVVTPPMISTIFEAMPPVQLIVRGELRTTLVGKGADRVSGAPRVSDVLNDPTSLPPAPVKV
jgi:uncharacterized protein (DUF111 family)